MVRYPADTENGERKDRKRKYKGKIEIKGVN
jgi:hypothetical protein